MNEKVHAAKGLGPCFATSCSWKESNLVMWLAHISGWTKAPSLLSMAWHTQHGVLALTLSDGCIAVSSSAYQHLAYWWCHYRKIASPFPRP